ncbi:P63C domain-containing protein [Microbacterium sp. AG1240]|uniref:P63C domain-containing protein n=1 Tax=Microbacterium sp. AG1240 TaxID=2183992 RepID=UPI000EAB8D15|nr:P63C domain-containing protein [Microbacterium sp. AG1240]RKT33690.1 P63C domain-containing protein [Microbacterium sp. AG1240]
MTTEIELTGRAAGGAARAARMSSAERSAAAKRAAEARWGGGGEVREVLAGSPDSPLRIGEAAVECYVLDDGTRVITQASMLHAIGRSRRVPGAEGSDESLPPILRAKSIRRFIPDDVIEQAQPISFKLPNGVRANGYRADLLPTICEIYLAARADGALPPNQRHIAQQAEILVRALAHVGIIALVDEATGYQELRTKDALSKILEAFVAKELQPWVKTFPPEFYREMFRLRNIPYDPASVHRPQYFGVLTNDVIYDRLAPGVREELKAAQKKSEKKSGKMFQHLTQSIGYPKLREHLGSVVTLMRLSTDWDDFKAKLNMIHPSYKHSAMPLWNDSDFGL